VALTTGALRSCLRCSVPESAVASATDFAECESRADSPLSRRENNFVRVTSTPPPYLPRVVTWAAGLPAGMCPCWTSAESGSLAASVGATPDSKHSAVSLEMLRAFSQRTQFLCSHSFSPFNTAATFHTPLFRIQQSDIARFSMPPCLT